LTTFGHELDGRPDAIIGFDLDYVTITDPHVIGHKRQRPPSDSQADGASGGPG
jgi:hypothetical protein